MMEVDGAETVLDTDEDKAAVIADFDPPPTGIAGAPGYAIQVFRRQREIKGKIVEINGQLEEAEKDRNKVEAVFGQAAIDHGLIPETAEEIQEKVQEAERAIAGAMARNEKATMVHQNELERIDQEVRDLTERLGPLAERERTYKAEYKAAQAEFRRHAMMLRRKQIEVRNIEKILAKGKMEPGAIEQSKQRIASIKTEIVGLMKPAKAAENKVLVLRKEGNKIGTKVKPVQKQIKELEAAKEKAIETFETEMGDAAQAAKRARVWKQSRLAEAGRSCFDEAPRPEIPGTEPIIPQILECRSVVQGIQDELDLHIKALDAHDDESMKKGIMLIAGVGALFVAGILLTVVMLI